MGPQCVHLCIWAAVHPEKGRLDAGWMELRNCACNYDERQEARGQSDRPKDTDLVRLGKRMTD